MIAPIKSTPWQPTDLLVDFFNQKYRPLKLAARAERTRLLYVATLGNFDKWLGRAATLADLNDDTVSMHIASYVERGCSPRTGNKSRDQLLAIWRFAARKRFVEAWPDVEPLPEYKREPNAFTLEQLDRLLRCVEDGSAFSHRRRKPICGIPCRVWWLGLLMTIYSTAARIGAVMQLRCADFDPESGKLLIRAETQKHRQDHRVILRGKAKAILEARLLFGTEGLLFPWPIAPTHLYYHYTRILKSAGLDHDRRSLFHKLCKTSATRCTRAKDRRLSSCSTQSGR